MKTSVNDPLRIAQVSSPGTSGAIGLTLCPDKKDREAGVDPRQGLVSGRRPLRLPTFPSLSGQIA